MSPFKMRFKNLSLITALLLAWRVCRVDGHAARVDYTNQPYTSSVATCVQATPQLVIPAIYAPIVSPYNSYNQESAPNKPSYNGFNGYSNYVPSFPQPMPPIIIEDDDDDSWQNILYFLLFALRNKKSGSENFGGYNGGCGCGGGCNCGGGGFNYGNYGGCGCGGGSYGCCGGYNGGYNGGCDCCGSCGGFSCIPYPFPYPMYSGFGGFPEHSGGHMEDQPGQNQKDINLIIKTDQS